MNWPLDNVTARLSLQMYDSQDVDLARLSLELINNWMNWFIMQCSASVCDRRPYDQWIWKKIISSTLDHGFRLGRSCLSQLIAHYDHITRLLESGHNVDVIYIDFAKAFDKVDYLVTMKKLKGMGISGKLGRWIHAFLTNRKQAVVVNGTKSMPADVKSGVPQGSVLGPLLFLVLIGDIDREVATAFVSSFADDTRAANGISTNADVCDLQVDLDAIYHWADENNMEFNNTKFECLRYGCNNDLKACTSYKAKSGECITEVDNAKDLGVTLSSNGNFKEYIKNVLSTATQLCGWVLRTFNTRKTLPMMTLWKALIRSRLDYCCQLWSPSKKGDVQALEQLQRQYIRKISGVQHLTYWQQLKYISLNSLERRRERCTSCMCGAYWNDTLQILTCQGIVGSIVTGTYVEEGIALFLELVIRPHQQFKRYDMEVSLYEAPCSLIPCHQNCEIRPTVHPNHSSKHWTHLSKLYLMSLRHLDTPTWDERSLIVWSIWFAYHCPTSLNIGRAWQYATS